MSTALLIGVVVTLIIIGVVQSERGSPQMIALPTPEIEGGDGQGDGETVRVYEDFEYTESVAGTTVFHLTARRTLGMASGWHELEAVQLELFQTGTKSGTLRCERAQFNERTHDAKLSGGVHLELSGGGFLDTPRGEYTARSQTFSAEGEVFFAGHQMIGHSGGAVYRQRDDLIELTGDVLIQREGGGVVVCPRLIYNRDTTFVRFPDGVDVAFGPSLVRAPVATMDFRGDDGPVERVAFEGGVEITGAETAAPTTIEGWTERLVGTRDAAGLWQVLMTTTGPWIEMHLKGELGALRRTVQTQRLRAVVDETGPQTARASEQVCIESVPVEGPRQWSSSEKATLRFRQGTLTDAELRQNVELYGDGMTARSAVARLLAGSAVTVLQSAPDGNNRAVITSGDARVSGDRVEIRQRQGVAVVEGAVQGQMENLDLLGVPADAVQSPEPVLFAADTLEATTGGSVLHLKDNARAWQGSRLLIAEEIIYRQEQARLEAFGHVRTTLPAVELDPTAGPQDEVLILARSLVYDRVAGSIVYSGQVSYTDTLHTMTAERLRILQDEENAVTVITATDKVTITERATGRRMEGDEARYDVAEGRMLMTGDPVYLIDEKGNAYSGSTLTWDRSSDRVTLSGGTETIYHMEEQP
jgi:lipopolysaccharide transport protein LptA